MTRSFAFSLSIMSHFSCSLQHVLPSSLNWHFKTRASHDHEVHANSPRQHHTTSIFTTKKIPATALVSIRQALMMSTLWRENSGSISGAFLPETVGVWWQKGDDQQVVRVRTRAFSFFLPVPTIRVSLLSLLSPTESVILCHIWY